MFRFQIKVKNVYVFLSAAYVSQVEPKKHLISGWVKGSELEDLRKEFDGLDITLIPEEEYWEKYDFYNK